MIKNIAIFILGVFILTGCNNSDETAQKVDYKNKQAETNVKPPVSSTLKDNQIKINVRNASYPLKDPGGNKLSNYYELRERQIDIPLNQTALILIDTWDLEKPRFKNSRGINVAKEIKPILKIARELDMLVLHAPHRPIRWDGINHNAQNVDLRGPTDTPRSEIPAWLKTKKIRVNQWPPVEFVYRVGEYSKYSRYSNPSYIPYPKIRGINKELLPKMRSREYIESSLINIQKIFKDNNILHLLYVGEATNQCVVQRPVGIRQMSSLGYDTIIVRGATLGSELNKTYESQLVTKSAILDIEINHGFSVSKDNLLNALALIKASM